MMPTFQEESTEFLPVAVAVGGLPHTTGLSFALVPVGSRPSTFTDSITLYGETGIMVTGLRAGPYDVYTKVSDVAPEVPEIWCGRISIVGK